MTSSPSAVSLHIPDDSMLSMRSQANITSQGHPTMPIAGGLRSHNSGAWLRKLFAKSMDEDSHKDMPEWYYSKVLQSGDPSTFILDDKLPPKQTQVFKPMVLNKKCSPVDMNSIHSQNNSCNGELAKLTVGISGIDNSKKNDPSKWICRDKKPQRGKRIKTGIQLLMDGINRRTQEALALLMDELEKGLLPRSDWQKCDITYQYGIDLTPTPSRCEDAGGVYPKHLMNADDLSTFSSSYYTYSTDSKGGSQTSQQLIDDITSYLDKMDGDEVENALLDPDGQPVYCPVLNFEVENYVREPIAENLLKSVGAMDYRGYLLCNYTDFDKVEHAVKNLLVNLARDHCSRLATRSKGNSNGIQALKDSPNSGYDLKAQRRDQLSKILKTEMISSGLLTVEEPPKPIHRTTIYRDSLPVPVPLLVTEAHRKREHKSLQQQKLAQDVGSQIITSLDRKSLLDENDESLIEIMPFQYRDSFDDSVNDGTAQADHHHHHHHSHLQQEQQQKTKLQERVKAEYKSWAHPKNCLPCPDDMSPEQSRSTQEWQNRKIYGELQLKETLTPSDRRLFIVLKYSLRWMELTRRNKSWRMYSPCGTPGLWAGPYPPYILKRIRAMKRFSKFNPGSMKDFYKGVRKLEAAMFESLKTNLFKEMEDEVVEVCVKSEPEPEHDVNNDDGGHEVSNEDHNPNPVMSTDDEEEEEEMPTSMEETEEEEESYYETEVPAAEEEQQVFEDSFEDEMADDEEDEGYDLNEE